MSSTYDQCERVIATVSLLGAAATVAAILILTVVLPAVVLVHRYPVERG